MVKQLVVLMATFWLSLPMQAAVPDLAQALAGTWTGSLQYRDFQSERQVVLPTTVTFSGPSTALQGDYVYDDGPGKTVRSSEHWALSAEGATLSLDPAGTPARITSFRAGSGLDLTLEAEGAGEESKQAVAVRTQLERHGSELTITRLTRLPGQPWLVRHVYRLTQAYSPTK